MANVLGTLFQDIANAIRSKTGGSGTMKPAEFPEKINGITFGTEDIDDMLDAINGEIIGETLYHVTFIGADGTALGEVPVYEGRDCDNPVTTGVIETPTKESSRYYNYIFSGWSFTEGGAADSAALKAVEADRTVYAAFVEEVIKVDSGVLSDNYGTSNWYIDVDGVMFIEGTENGRNLTSTVIYNAFGNSYRKTITSLKLRNVNMFDHCFDGWSALVDVEWSSDYMAHMTRSCFSGCPNLKTFTFWVDTCFIYEGQFVECPALETVNFKHTDGWVIETESSDTVINVSSETMASTTAFLKRLNDLADNQYFARRA